jgi:hypothetical protein
MRKTGRIILTMNEEKPTKLLSNEEAAVIVGKRLSKVLDVEQYLNNTVAAQIYTKFGVLIRVHL